MLDFESIVGTLGKLSISLSVVCCMVAMVYYFRAANFDNERYLKVGNWMFMIKGFFMITASGILIYLIMTHQFQYYYVFNYTSLDLQPRYLFSAFYGGQEGSFMLWILFSWVSGIGLIKWTRLHIERQLCFFFRSPNSF